MSAKYVTLFRGVGPRKGEIERAGRWWSTSPWYAMRHRSRDGTLYVAEVEESELKALAKDKSIEEDFQNYLFVDRDPPGTREASREEIDEYSKHEIPSTPNSGSPGSRFPKAVFIKKPEDHVELGRRIFGRKSKKS